MFEKLIHLEGIDPLEFFGVNNAKMNLIKSFFPKLIIVYRGNDVIIKGDDEEILRFESKFHLITDHYNQFNVLPDDVINQVFLNESEGISETLDEEKDVLVNIYCLCQVTMPIICIMIVDTTDKCILRTS